MNCTLCLPGQHRPWCYQGQHVTVKDKGFSGFAQNFAAEPDSPLRALGDHHHVTREEVSNAHARGFGVTCGLFRSHSEPT